LRESLVGRIREKKAKKDGEQKGCQRDKKKNRRKRRSRVRADGPDNKKV